MPPHKLNQARPRVEANGYHHAARKAKKQGRKHDCTIPLSLRSKTNQRRTVAYRRRQLGIRRSLVLKPTGRAVGRRPAKTLTARPLVPLRDVVAPAHRVAAPARAQRDLGLVAEVEFGALGYAVVERGKGLHDHGVAAVRVDESRVAGFAELVRLAIGGDGVEGVVGGGAVAEDGCGGADDGCGREGWVRDGGWCGCR
jgi:hypothetical protein